MTRYSYQELLALVDGDANLVEMLVQEGEIRCQGDVALVDIDRVLVVRTLVQDLEVTWAGAEVILELRAKLLAAQRRIAELEEELARKPH